MKQFYTLFFIFLIGCGNTELVNREFLQACANQTQMTERSFTAVRQKLTPIEVGPEHHKPMAAYSILNTDKASYVLATSPGNQEFTIYDITHGEIIKNTKLDYPPLEIGQATFKSFDSIYFQLPMKNTIIRFDSAGVVGEKTIIKDIQTDWQVRGNPPGFFNEIHQAELKFLSRNRVISTLNTFGFWYYRNKKDIKLLAELDLDKSQMTSNFSKMATALTKAPIELHDMYTMPYMEHYQGYIYVSYPYDHNLYKYDATTKELVKTTCLSSQFIGELGIPLELNHSDQENINFQISNAYYGKINFHSTPGIFSRVVFHEKDLYKSDGKLNRSACDRTYSLILFDSELNLLSEIDLQNLDLWNRALPTPSGYVVPGICQESSGEDFFEFNIKYDLEEIIN